MILSILGDGTGQENIFRNLVLVKLVHVQLPSLVDARLARLVSSLLAIELVDHDVDGTNGILLDLGKKTVHGFVHATGILIVVATSTFNCLGINALVELLVIHDGVVKIDIGKSADVSSTTASIHVLLKILLQVLHGIPVIDRSAISLSLITAVLRISIVLILVFTPIIVAAVGIERRRFHLLVTKRRSFTIFRKTKLFRSLLFLVLDLIILIVDEIINVLAQNLDIIVSTSHFTPLDENHLFGSEDHIVVKNRTNLEMKVHAVNEGKIIDVLAFNLKHVHFINFLVPVEEVTTQTRIFFLDHALNTSILNDVPNKLGKVHVLTNLLGEVNELLRSHSWGVEGMANLMADEHVHQAASHVLPHRERQNALVEVE